MKKGFWGKLPRPVFTLAPMADVTDPPYRRIIAARGRPDVFFTEFVSADGLSHPEARGRILRDIEYSEAERPIVLQIFGAKPENFKKTAELARKLGFDGIDINSGCPDRSVEKQGAGAALIKNPKLMEEITAATKEGAGELPVSIKTRLGYNTDEVETWIPALLEMEPAALTIHLRTRKEMSKVPARWERMKRIVEIRNEMECETLLLGNGDIADVEDARVKVEESGADGAMLGRAIFGNPWLFANLAHARRGGGIRLNQTRFKQALTLTEVLETLVEHCQLYEELIGDVKSFAVMKKHFKAYITGFDGAKELRIKLMEAHNARDIESTVKKFLARSQKEEVVL